MIDFAFTGDEWRVVADLLEGIGRSASTGDRMELETIIGAYAAGRRRFGKMRRAPEGAARAWETVAAKARALADAIESLGEAGAAPFEAATGDFIAADLRVSARFTADLDRLRAAAEVLAGWERLDRPLPPRADPEREHLGRALCAFWAARGGRLVYTVGTDSSSASRAGEASGPAVEFLAATHSVALREAGETPLQSSGLAEIIRKSRMGF